MGYFQDGQWKSGWYPSDDDGRFVRPPTSFRDTVAPDDIEPGRYHLYVSLACPWAHRALIARELLGLEKFISVSVVDWFLDDDGDGYGVDGTLIEAWAAHKSFKPREGGDGPAPEDSGNPSVNFRGEKRTNTTHRSTTDPEARLCRKGPGREAKLCFMGHLLMEGRHGLAVHSGHIRAQPGTGGMMVNAAVVGYGHAGRHFHAYLIGLAGKFADIVKIHFTSIIRCLMHFL